MDRKFKSIVCADANWGIGCEGNLLVRIPEDMKYFKHATMCKVVVMGRKTFESLPGKKPLSDRTNIIITNDESYKVDGAKVVHSMEELYKTLEPYPADEVYIIGGADIYRQLLYKCDRVLVTRVSAVYDADSFFPDLDSDDDWEIFSETNPMVYNGVWYRRYVYQRVNN